MEGIPQLIERAGRVAYKSEDKIGPETADPFCRMLIKRGHEAVIEHASITVKFTIDRAISLELVRHRIASYTQTSTRFCSFVEGGRLGGVTFIIPPWVDIEPGEYQQLSSYRDPVVIAWATHMLKCEQAYNELSKAGWKPEQARSVLPNSLKTEIVMSANLREWRHVFRLRCAKAAHPQAREVMIPLRNELAARLPAIFEDLLDAE